MEIGFEGAPVTRAIALITLTFSLAFDASALSLQLPALFRGQIWVSLFNSQCLSSLHTNEESVHITSSLLELLPAHRWTHPHLHSTTIREIHGNEEIRSVCVCERSHSDSFVSGSGVDRLLLGLGPHTITRSLLLHLLLAPPILS